MRRELDVLVSMLGGPVVAGDQTHPVDSLEVPVHERVAGLRLLARARRQAEVPLGVLVPLL